MKQDMKGIHVVHGLTSAKRDWLKQQHVSKPKYYRDIQRYSPLGITVMFGVVPVGKGVIPPKQL